MTDIAERDADDVHGTDGVSGDDDDGTNRRRFLTGGAIAAAAAVAGVALTARPASALNGNAIIIGKSAPPNTGTNLTLLTGSTLEISNGNLNSTSLIGSHTLSTSSIGIAGIANDGSGTPAGGTGVMGTAGDGGTGVNGSAGGTGVGVTGAAVGAGTGVSGTAADGGTGVSGTTPGAGTGVSGTTATGKGVSGTSADGGVGVFGNGAGTSGSPSIGVEGHVTAGSGVYGEVISGSATDGDASGQGLRGKSDYGAALFLDETTKTVVPSGGPWSAGAFLVKNGHLWYCYKSGTPGSWVRLSSVFVPLNVPKRVYDTRPGASNPPATGPKTPIVGTRTGIDLKNNNSGVPAGISGALISVVALNSLYPGFGAFFRNGAPYPNTSNINFGAGQVVAVTTFCGVDANSLMSIFSFQQADYVVDVLGYYI